MKRCDVTPCAALVTELDRTESLLATLSEMDDEYIEAETLSAHNFPLGSFRAPVGLLQVLLMTCRDQLREQLGRAGVEL